MGSEVMARIDVYLKGGAIINLNVEDFGMKLNGLGHITEVNWKRGKDRPMHIQPSEVAAVIER
jgi:hypothetical protein